MTTCYRHPSRETRVSCSRCGKPICPDCMTPSPVGMRCPDCAGDRTKVRTIASTSSDVPRVTVALISLNLIAFLFEGSFGASRATGSLATDFGLFGPAVAAGDWYRLVTCGFLHAGPIHIGFNMLLLWLLGRELEQLLGPWRFAALYLSSLLAGSFGALLLSPNALTVGASGAVFGLMGATAAIQYARGINPMHTDIGGLIGINLVLSVVLSNISLGGHLGGLIGGGLIGLAFATDERRGRGGAAGWAACVVVAAVAVAGSLAVV